MNAEVRRRLARKLPKLRSIDDLLTPAEQEELRADLARIHDTVRPCWTDQRPQQSAACVCCGKDSTRRQQPDPWEGRLDGYCDECATARCDAEGSHFARPDRP